MLNWILKSIRFYLYTIIEKKKNVLVPLDIKVLDIVYKGSPFLLFQNEIFDYYILSNKKIMWWLCGDRMILLLLQFMTNGCLECELCILVHAIPLFA